MTAAPSELAQLLACQPVIVANLLTEHVPDAGGRCKGPGCAAVNGRPAKQWPCTLHEVAEQARRISRQGQERK